MFVFHSFLFFSGIMYSYLRINKFFSTLIIFPFIFLSLISHFFFIIPKSIIIFFLSIVSLIGIIKLFVNYSKIKWNQIQTVAIKLLPLLPGLFYSYYYCIIIKKQLFSFSFTNFTSKLVLSDFIKQPYNVFSSMNIFQYNLFKINLFDLPKITNFLLIIYLAFILIGEIKKKSIYVSILPVFYFLITSQIFLDGNNLILNIIFLVCGIFILENNYYFLEKYFPEKICFVIFAFFISKPVFITVLFIILLKIVLIKYNKIELLLYSLMLVLSLTKIDSISKYIFIWFLINLIIKIRFNIFYLFISICLFNFGTSRDFFQMNLIFIPTLFTFILNLKYKYHLYKSIKYFFPILILILSFQMSVIFDSYSFFSKNIQKFNYSYPISYKDTKMIFKRSDSILVMPSSYYYLTKSYIPWVKLYPDFWRLPNKHNYYFIDFRKNSKPFNAKKVFSNSRAKIYKVE